MKIEWDKSKIMARLVAKVGEAIQKSGEDLANKVKASLNQGKSGFGGSPSAPGMPPHNSTGALMRSIMTVNTTTDPLHPSCRVGTSLVYAAIQEYGGRIVPKKGKYLTVPIGDAGRRAAREARGDISRLQLRLVVTKNGRLLLVADLHKGQRVAKGEKKAGGDMSVPLFVLKRFVILPPRPYMRPAYNAAGPDIQLRIAKGIKSALTGVN